MRLAVLQALSLCLALTQACTEAQDLGDSPDRGGDGDGDGTQIARDEDDDESSEGTGDGTGPGEVDDNPISSDGDSDAVITERGSFEAFTPQTLAYYRRNSDLGLGLVSEDGTLGCALGGDESGAPGGEASLVLVKLPTSDNAEVCPEGSYAIRRDPEYCSDLSFFGLPAKCGVFRQWNDDGELTAEVLAIGGGISLGTDDEGNCKVELAVTFPGGHKVEQSFNLAFSELDTSNDDYCFH
jgi:hypothetical protein